LILALGDEIADADSDLVKTDDLVWVANSDRNPLKVEIMPLIVAAEGCIYRQRAIQRLDQSELPWQIVYTNPDLTGIQYAIQEDLGVTVLAKSTVPTNLKVVPDSSRFPDLGRVGINLICDRTKKEDQAISLLIEFLKTSLA